MLQYQLILASESPRRRQLLQEAGFQITVHPTQISEILNKNLNVEAQILELAGRKSAACLTSLKQDQELAASAGKARPLVVLAADTMVVIDGEPLGKPINTKEAAEMLGGLSGRTHVVMTGVSFRETENEREISKLIQTEVEFHALTEDKIWTYIESKEPLDKAGSYGIQGLGRQFVKEFRGSYSNVVGLPMEYVESVLTSPPFNLEPKNKYE